MDIATLRNALIETAVRVRLADDGYQEGDTITAIDAYLLGLVAADLARPACRCDETPAVVDHALPYADADETRVQILQLMRGLRESQLGLAQTDAALNGLNAYVPPDGWFQRTTDQIDMLVDRIVALETAPASDLDQAIDRLESAIETHFSREDDTPTQLTQMGVCSRCQAKWPMMDLADSPLQGPICPACAKATAHIWTGNEVTIQTAEASRPIILTDPKPVYDAAATATTTAATPPAPANPCGKPAPAQARCLEALKLAPSTCKALAVQLDMSTATTYSILTRLLTKGLIVQHGEIPRSGQTKPQIIYRLRTPPEDEPLVAASVIPARPSAAEYPPAVDAKTKARTLVLTALDKGGLTLEVRGAVTDLTGLTGGALHRFVTDIQEEYRAEAGRKGFVNGRGTKRRSLGELASEERHTGGIDALAAVMAGEDEDE